VILLQEKNITADHFPAIAAQDDLLRSAAYRLTIAFSGEVTFRFIAENASTQEDSMAADVTIFYALLAGVVSFLSPCVLPLVPPYLVIWRHLARAAGRRGAAAPGAARHRDRGAAVRGGFSTVFVALGASASAVGALVRYYSSELAIVAGIAIIVMGLHFLGITPIRFLYGRRVSTCRSRWGCGAPM